MITNSIDIFKRKKIVYISPHFDDMVLSNGGIIRNILNNNGSIVLVNVFTKSSWSSQLENKNERYITRIRELEDNKYCVKLGIQNINLGFNDSSIRGYNDINELFASVDNDSIFFCIKQKLYTVLKNINFDYVLCPLAIGQHIDHEIVFKSIKSIYKLKVLFYEDLPYGCKYSDSYIRKCIKKKLDYPKEYYFDITEVIDNKCNDISIYKSQLEKQLVSDVINYSNRFENRKHYERLWG